MCSTPSQTELRSQRSTNVGAGAGAGEAQTHLSFRIWSLPLTTWMAWPSPDLAEIQSCYISGFGSVQYNDECHPPRPQVGLLGIRSHLLNKHLQSAHSVPNSTLGTGHSNMKVDCWSLCFVGRKQENSDSQRL